MILVKKKRLADAQGWTVTLPNWQKQPPEVLNQSLVELTLENDYLKLCFWTVTFKTILIIFTKISVAFKPEF